PMNTIKAVQTLPKYNSREIDTVWINGHCMINVGGLGFDAHISKAFANKKKRGLWGYVKTIIKQLNYKSEEYEILKNGEKVWSGYAFMIGIANATQWGNNVILHPGASPSDGLVQVVVIRKF